MKIRWLSVVLALALVAAAFAAFPAPRALAAGVTYYSQGSLAPNLTSSWNTVRGGGGSTPANFTGGDVFVIQNGHNMTTSAAWSVSGTSSKLWIENGGTLTATSAVTLATATTFQIDAGGTYIHNNTTAYGSSIFQAGTKTFNATSTVILNNSNTTGPSGVSFGNLTVNFTSDPGGSVNCSGGLTTINGDLTIQSTSTREFRLSGNTSYTLNLVGNLSISGGILNLTNGSNSALTYVVNIGGDFSQTGGTFTSGNTNSIATVVFTGGSPSVTFATAGGTFTNTNINWQIASGKTVANNTNFGGGSWVNASRTMTVNGAFQINQGSWTGSSGTWSYDSGATLIFNNTSGSYGSIDNTHVYWPDSNGPTNVNVQGAGGITLGVTRTVNGAFQTAAGVINGHNLTLNGTTQINAGGYFDTNSPTYGASATLVYNPGGSYNIGAEWKSGGAVGSGVPKNVIIQNNTAVVLPNGAGSRTVGGNLTIGNGSSLTLGGNIGDDLNVGGNWINNGTFNANNRAVTFTGTTTVSGSSTTSFAYVTITGALTGHSGSMNVANNWTNNGTFNPNGGAVHFNGTGGQAIGGTTISSFFDVFIETFSSVTGPAGGTLNVAGNWTNNGAFNHNGGTVVFNGSTGQAIGGSAATTFNNLTINNASGVSLGGGQAVDAVLNLSAGRLTLGANSLTLGSGATVGGTPGGANMVVADGSGFLKKASAGSLSFTFPVGDSAGNYTPVALNCPALSSGSSIDVRLTASAHPHMAGSDYIKRYWTMQSAAASVSCTAIFSYVFTDVMGTESLIRPVKWNGAWHALTSGSVDTGSHTLTGGFTSFSDFTGGNPAPLAVALASMNAAAQGAAIQVTWETVSEVGNAGFNLYRDTSPAGPGVKLNAGLIPSQGPNSPSGFSYLYTDAAGLVPGTTYTYWLEDVSLGGIATRHEPVSALYAGPNAVALANFRATTAGTLPRITRISRISVLAVFGLFLVVVGSVGGAVLARRRG